MNWAEDEQQPFLDMEDNLDSGSLNLGDRVELQLVTSKACPSKDEDQDKVHGWVRRSSF